MDFKFTEEQQYVRDVARKFADNITFEGYAATLTA